MLKDSICSHFVPTLPHTAVCQRNWRLSCVGGAWKGRVMRITYSITFTKYNIPTKIVLHSPTILFLCSGVKFYCITCLSAENPGEIPVRLVSQKKILINLHIREVQNSHN